MSDQEQAFIKRNVVMFPKKQGRFLTSLLGRFCLLVFSLALVGGVALAQTAEPVTTAPKPAEKPLLPPDKQFAQTLAASPAQIILYDQIDHGGTSSFPSQAFEPALAHFDSQGADDFIIPISDNAGDLVIDLPSPAVLPAGTYWLSVQADLDYGPDQAQWFWETRALQRGNPFAWQNPGEGFSLGCPTWSPGNSVCGLGGDDPDTLFQLLGTVPIPVSFQLDWSSIEVDDTRSVAWGDYDGDGDLDLAVGNSGGPNKLYRNDAGKLTAGAIWSSDEADTTLSLAWGDYDGDGDLDLAVGNYSRPNRIYRNENGILATGAVWSSAEADNSYSLAWGDYDGDGDLDLAVGNGIPFSGSGQPNRLYRNDNGILTTAAVWSSFQSEDTNSVAWGDYDGDGDLDLAVGNGNSSAIGQPNRLYRNDDGMLTTNSVWSSRTIDNTFSVIWGDYDDDGDLDLAVGNGPSATGQPNRLYRNNGVADDGVTPLFKAVWASEETDQTLSAAWGDYDGDGDLDLSVGNDSISTGHGGSNRLYRNDSGTLTTGAVWSSLEADATTSIAWADYDGDGDLDLAVGNRDQPNRLYRNDGAGLTNSAVWLSDETVNPYQIAWGDYDSDGDLDLAATAWSSLKRNSLFRNEDGVLTTGAVWSSAEADYTYSLAWGDYDGDGDLDLAVGNFAPGDQDLPNRLYRNENGALTTGAVWSSVETGATWDMAWGDYDGDGDLDLAVGNGNRQPNLLYRNDDGTMTANAVWSSVEADSTFSVAWGDYDGDGDLDLAAGNYGQSNRLYRNEGLAEDGRPLFSLVWSSTEADRTSGVAWGDHDGDGDLDLAAGNDNQPNRIYRNDNGELTVSRAWSSIRADDTTGIAWGDYDGDGDLDLVAANHFQPNRLYRNDSGELTSRAVWSSDEADSTRSIAWGDVDGDGDLDLAVGNSNNEPAKIYWNLRRGSAPLVNNPPYVLVPRPGVTDDADFFSTPHIIQTAEIPINYTLFDSEADIVPKIFPEFSPNGGGEWFSATPGSGGDGLTNLTASPEGTTHTFVWHAEVDLIKSDNVKFRIKAQPHDTYSPILWPAVDGKSPSFRMESPWYIKVIDHNGSPVVSATVYADGQPITQTVTGLPVTDRAGLLNPGRLPQGTALVALIQQEEQPTIRGAHDGWAYRTYLTNVVVDDAGDTQPFIVAQPGPQVLTVRPENVLVLFNLVVSVEWDATAAYLQDVALAMERAADFLYDVSDGQMTFGRVAIYDRAQHWAEADLQISAKNVIWPHAHVGGLFGGDKAHNMRVGRLWDGNRGNRGNWSDPIGFRTLVHEFGHFGLGLYDEYFAYDYREDDLAGHNQAFCTERPDTRPNPNPLADASIMDNHYDTSELADVGRWTIWCRNTAQHQLNNGEADWQTLLRLYSDPSGLNRWRLRNPDSRGQPGHVVSGPDTVPAALPFPIVTVANQGDDPEPVALQVCHQRSPYQEGVWVTLYANGKAMDQGLTDERGRLDILGARPGDTLQAVSLEGALSASTLLPLGGSLDLETTEQRALKNILPEAASQSVDEILALGAKGLAASADQTGPYLRLWPTASGGSLDGLRLAVTRTFSDDNLVYTLTGPDDLGPAGALVYEPAEDDHRVQIGFVPAALAGHARALGFHNDRFIDINADYRLQQAGNISRTTLFANDGNLKLYLEPESLPVDTVHFLLASPWGLPGPLPEGLQIIGEAYEITASANVTGLARPAVLTLRHDGAAASDFEGLSIYRWDFQAKTWQPFGGELDVEHQEVVTTTTTLGLYALLGRPTTTNRRYLALNQSETTNPCRLGSTAPNTPANPNPPDGATDISTDQVLSWEGGDLDGDLVTYTVAFGPNNPPPTVGTTTSTSYTPPTLISNTIYFWVITAGDGLNTTTGPTWRFTTFSGSPPAHTFIYLPLIRK